MVDVKNIDVDFWYILLAFCVSHRIVTDFLSLNSGVQSHKQAIVTEVNEKCSKHNCYKMSMPFCVYFVVELSKIIISIKEKI